MQEVQFNSNFTLDDYKKVSYFNVFGRKRLVSILCVVLLLVGIAYLIPNSFWGFSPLIGIICILYPIGLVVFTIYRIQKTIAGRKLPASSQQSITIGEDGLVCVKQEERTAYTWNDFDGIYETPDYFIVYTNQNKIVTLIKRDIDPGQAQTVRNLIINNLPHKKYRIKQ